MTSLIFGSSQEMDILPQMNTVPLQMQQTSSGNGQITMTTRLSIEIQGVPYDNIEKTIAFLGEHGLMTGGTGAKVRPVVYM